jgi:hypothetical protein
MVRGFLMSVLVLCVSCLPAVAEGLATTVDESPWEVSGATDLGTSMVEVRVGHDWGKDWTVGLLGTYFADDAEDPGEDWGIGAYAKLVVDPDASIPLAGWLPKIGDWLDLPESLVAETYLIGKWQALPYDDGIDMAGAVGAGAQVGPVFGEVCYDVIESGNADNPVATSGMSIMAGLCLEF